MKRLISVFLALVMILSSLSLGVFAVDGEDAAADAQDQAVAEEVNDADLTDEDFDIVDEDVVAEDGAEAKGVDGDQNTTDPAPAKPATVTGLATYSAYNSIALEWNPVAGATEYRVYRDGKKIATVKPNSKSVYDSKKMAYINKKIKKDKKYSYTVTAVKDGVESDKCAAKKDSRVRQMYITFTFSRTRKLTSHDKAKVTRKFKKGTKVKAHGYRLGRYHFDYKGHTFYVNYMSTSNTKAKYVGRKKWNYSKREAEYFANTSGIKSKTNFMIWASLYTQHIYILKMTDGLWRVKTIKYNGTKGSDWEISSGKAATPSPTGTNLQIFRRQAYKRGVVWWNYFHSQTSIHGKAGEAPFGKPASSGCLRNPDKLASVIYHEIPLWTRVIVY